MAKENEKPKTKQAELSWLTGWRPYLVLSIIVFALYARTIGYEYTNLDDTTLIKNNSEWLSKSSLPDAFREDVFHMLPDADDVYYRPMLTVSFMIEHKLGGDSLAIYHFFNILFHLGTCLLLFRLLQLLGYTNRLAFIFSLLFAVHPVFAQAVAWVPGRNDSLLGLDVLASFVFLVQWLRHRKFVALLLHFVFFFLALFTKETALFLAPVFLLFAWMDKRRIASLMNTSLLLPAAGWIVLAMIYLAARSNALAGHAGLPAGEIYTQVLSNTPAMLVYLGKMLLPFGLSVFPVGDDLVYAWGIISLAGLAIVLFLAKGKKTPAFFFGAVWFLFLLLPALISKNINGERIFLEHRLYLPAIGLILVLAETGKAMGEKYPGLQRSWLIPGIAVVFFTALNLAHTSDYSTEEKFWTNATETSPHSAYAWGGIGKYHHDRGEMEKAANEYTEALKINPGAPDICNNLGQIYLHNGRYEEARQLLRRGFVSRQTENLYSNLGEALIGVDSLDQAELLLKKAITLAPSNSDAMNDLGTVYARRGNYADAVALWKKVETIAPNSSAATINIMKVLILQKKYDEAETYRQKLIAQGLTIDPIGRDSAR
jgi:Flp pilus assembly protein TadD